VYVNPTTSDPLSDASSPNGLLQELATLRKRSPRLNQYGLTHLFTARDLSGETVGIAYLNRLCHVEYGVGLTEVRGQAAWRDSLIAAHEIGHNFGANHDGDGAGACPSTPTGMYVMSPTVSGSDRFSQCSLDSMRPRVNAAACIVELPDADISIASDLGVRHVAVGKQLEWRIEVANLGGVAAERVRVDISVPPAVTIDDAYVVGGSCTSAAGAVLCQLGDLAGGAKRAVNLTLRSNEIGASAIAVQIASDNDAVLTNNRGAGELTVQQEADLGLELGGPATAVVGSDLRLTFTASNNTNAPASGVHVTLDLPAGLTATQASLSSGACTVGASRIDCTVASAPGAAMLTGALMLTPSAAGALSVRGAISGSYIDFEPANDAAQHAVTIEPAAVVVSQSTAEPGRSSGGGGSASWLLLLAMAGLRILRR
jgi:uncharacterized repeat protein (TIGR01451 family)